MDVDGLQAQAQAVMFATIGVAVTITRPAPDDTPIAATGIWLVQSSDESRPFGTDFQRREPRKLMALMRTGLSNIPRGTIISAPELQGGTAAEWRVDGFTRSAETDEFRVNVVPVEVNR